MKTLYLALFVAVAMSCMADISIGTGRRPAATAEPTADQPAAPAQADIAAEKTALLEVVKVMTDEKGAAAAAQQLAGQQAAMQDMAKKYDEAVRQIDALGPQVEALLQQEVSRVADMAQGKGLTSERDKKIHAILMQQIPESGYQAAGAHEIDSAPAPTPRAAKEAPPLRPLPSGI